jgi:hypothetical protein
VKKALERLIELASANREITAFSNGHATEGPSGW